MTTPTAPADDITLPAMPELLAAFTPRQTDHIALQRIVTSFARAAVLADRASPSRAATVTLTALNLRNALDFVAPDFEADEDQRASEVTIGWAPDRMSIDNEPLAAGYYCWLTDYPEEGAIPLDQGEWSSAAVDVGAAQAETAQAAPVAGLLSAEQWLHEIHKAAMYSSHKNMGVWDEPLANMIAAAARQFSITATPGATHGN